MVGGADIYARNGDGETALHMASWLSDYEMVQLLIDLGCDPNVKGGNEKRTALHFLNFCENTPDRQRVAYVLLTSGCDVHISDLFGRTVVEDLDWHKKKRYQVFQQKIGLIWQLSFDGIDSLKGNDADQIQSCEKKISELEGESQGNLFQWLSYHLICSLTSLEESDFFFDLFCGSIR